MQRGEPHIFTRVSAFENAMRLREDARQENLICSLLIGEYMSDEMRDAEDRYDVVVNQEEQYSIWAADRDVPAGWTKVGVQGSKESCLEHINEVWTDMRPLSLRRAMAAAPENQQ